MPKNSFLPEDYVEKRKQRRTNFFCLTLFVVVMVAIVGAFFVTDQQRVEVRELTEQVNQQYADAARRLEQLEELRVQKEAMMVKAQVTAVLIERIPRTLILSELINHMPGTLSLVDLDLQTKKVAGPAPQTALQRAKLNDPMLNDAPQADATEITISLVGLAPTDVEVSQYMTSLGTSPLILDQSLVYSREEKVDDTIMRRFKVELTIDQSVDVSKIEPTMVQRDKLDPMGNTLKIMPSTLTPNNSKDDQPVDVESGRSALVPERN